MATSKFFEKNKRKSIIALLLLFFREKRNLALLAVIMVAMAFMLVSLPPSMVASIPGAKYLMTLLGADGSFMPKRLAELMRERSQSSYWGKSSDRYSLFSQYYGSGKDASGASSIMITGTEDIFKNPDEEKDAAKKGKKGKDGSDPNVPEELDAEPSPVELGDLMEAKPVMDRGDFKGIGFDGMGDMKYVANPASSNMVVRMAINNANARIPSIGGRVAKVNSLGRISSFAWRNVDFARRRTDFGITKVGSKRAIRQLSETFSTTAIAYTRTNDSETSQALIGSTYDGSGTTSDWLDTSYNAAAGESTNPPDIGDTTATTLTTGTEELQAQAEACKEAQNTHGTEMSDAGNIMQQTGNGMGSPPSCCSGRVGSWNSGANTMYQQCIRYNTHSAALAAACQSQASNVNCSQYQSMHISPCSWLHCFFSLFLGLLLMVVGFLTMGLGIGIALIVAGAAMVVGSLVGGGLGSLLAAVGAAGAVFTGSSAASAATATAVGINSGTSTTTQ